MIIKFSDYSDMSEELYFPTAYPLVPCSDRDWETENQSLQVMRGIAESLKRIADQLEPIQPELVGTPYIADRLGCTTVWVTQMIRNGQIPQRCVVAGTGDGKPWKFVRRLIDEWIKNR